MNNTIENKNIIEINKKCKDQFILAKLGIKINMEGLKVLLIRDTKLAKIYKLKS